MSVELRPCPFCGGEPKFADNTSVKGESPWAAVWCPKCSIDGPERDDPAEAIAVWNTRIAAHPGTRERDDFYAARYAERCGDVLRLREALKSSTAYMKAYGDGAGSLYYDQIAANEALLAAIRGGDKPNA